MSDVTPDLELDLKGLLSTGNEVLQAEKVGTEFVFLVKRVK